ncbi:MAG: 50S ribosomal protein L13 [Candidatus Omnitrophica bacterium CG23_combo_of_CG06-09_8_20_14_all_41_10]|uniref:Large ribosomal subunit protein uL13 n=1 Tax=Candidatus Sherwoodlollariibacterium unditelluris TaxID=1974757 RepID=A0A2G9YKQ6_9BACT|nr:MAG: 50S ribosomal protein L13 [Candidatus Omnitrophica bacterium CG23_combo_of_CG06-09_8_20_14_all_41_10]
MTKTYIPKREDIKRQWYLVDAKDKILGRFASKVAAILRGKHKPMFTPHLDTGDAVIVINAAKLRVTGRKAEQKVYRRYSGYPGGLREVSFEKMFKDKPEAVVELAVRRMLPKGPLGRDMLKKLKIYADDKHLHKAQNPIILEG